MWWAGDKCPRAPFLHPASMLQPEAPMLVCLCWYHEISDPEMSLTNPCSKQALVLDSRILTRTFWCQIPLRVSFFCTLGSYGHFSIWAHKVCSKQKTAHVTSLLKTLQRFPISLRMTAQSRSLYPGHGIPCDLLLASSAFMPHFPVSSLCLRCPGLSYWSSSRPITLLWGPLHVPSPCLESSVPQWLPSCPFLCSATPPLTGLGWPLLSSSFAALFTGGHHTTHV